jgi:hypothetical protein
MGWVQEGVAPSILGEVQFGVQGQSPTGCLGTKSPEAEGFFSFSEGDCCTKLGGGGHHQWKILGVGRPQSPNLRGATGAAEKGAAAPTPTASSLDPPLGLTGLHFD